MLTAITREVSRSIVNAELTYLERTPIDIKLARSQHRAYQDALTSLGVRNICLREEPDLPDSVFVEDTAVVLDECAIITYPGAESRRAETRSIVEALKPFRDFHYIKSPGTLDGGDVLTIGRDIFIGLSTRSNADAVRQVQDILQPFGYRVHSIPVSSCLHLKSSVTQVGEDTLLINPARVDHRYFPGRKFILCDPAEPSAANALMVGGTVLFQSAYPRTRERLEAAGIPLLMTDQSEVAKAEGALTCCSLIFKTG